jgi:hypothetical protein
LPGEARPGAATPGSSSRVTNMQIVLLLIDEHMINWLPDPTTLLHVLRARAGNRKLGVFYPGRGLSGLELDILDEFFPRLTFHSFETAIS